MMTNTQEALQMAIDFLDGSYEAHKVRKACQEALKQTSEYVVNSGGTGTELRKQQEQEPKYWIWATGSHIQVSVEKPDFDGAEALYTHPVCVSTHAKQLSDDDIWDLYDKSDKVFVVQEYEYNPYSYDGVDFSIFTLFKSEETAKEYIKSLGKLDKDLTPDLYIKEVIGD